VKIGRRNEAPFLTENEIRKPFEVTTYKTHCCFGFGLLRWFVFDGVRNLRWQDIAFERKNLTHIRETQRTGG